MPAFEMSAQAHIGFIALRVKDLQVMTDFYTKIVGLIILKQDQDTVYLGSEQQQNVLITLRQVPETKFASQASQLTYVTLALPDLMAFRMALDQLQANQIELKGTYETNRDYQIEIMDPEAHIVRLSVAKARQKTELTFERAPIELEAVLPKRGTADIGVEFIGISAIGIKVPTLEPVIAFYQKVLGFKLSLQNKQRALLTNPKNKLLIELQLDEPQALATTLDFINIVLPKLELIDALATHLKQQALTDYQYLPDHHYLMLNDPAKTNLCFSIS